MKRFALLLVIGAVLFSLSTAQAALIGIKDYMTFPDILFDTKGKITYKYDSINQSGMLVLDALDRTITMANGDEYYLTGTGFTTTFKLEITVDNSGNMVRTGKMVEEVTVGTVTIDNYSYSAGDVLLAGTVTAFGWYYDSTPKVGLFDFEVQNLYGKLVDDGIWPDKIPTGIFAVAEKVNGWTGYWDKDFDLYKVKGDKAPVPIPTTAVLLGSGLLGLIGLARRSRKK